MNQTGFQSETPALIAKDSTLATVPQLSVADTSYYPCMKGKSPYSALEDFPVAYKMGFFQDNPILHAECERSFQGIPNSSRSSAFWRTDPISGSLLFCFIILAVLLQRNGSQLMQQAKGFFFSPSNARAQFNIDTNLGTYAPVVSTFILSYASSLLMFWHLQLGRESFTSSTPPLQILGICSLIWCAYFIVKNLIYAFVDGIFFDKISVVNWRKYRSFILTIETLFLFVFATVSVLLDISHENVLYVVFLAIITFKVLHVFKCFQIFFNQKYGYLHLIMYFCTLELVPLMVILKVLIQITVYLTVKN